MPGTPKPQSPRKCRATSGAGQGRLARQVFVAGGAVSEELEDGVRAQGVVVVLVLVAGQNAIDAGADHLQKGVLGEVMVAGVLEHFHEGPGEPDALVELAHGE
jgi:hypothetical protein